MTFVCTCTTYLIVFTMYCHPNYSWYNSVVCTHNYSYRTFLFWHVHNWFLWTSPCCYPPLIECVLTALNIAIGISSYGGKIKRFLYFYSCYNLNLLTALWWYHSMATCYNSILKYCTHTHIHTCRPTLVHTLHKRLYVHVCISTPPISLFDF